MTDTTQAPPAPIKEWAIVELMGHRQRGGVVKEVEMFGTKLLRVDIPAGDEFVTEYYGGSAIYALRPGTEELVREWCRRQGDVRPARPVDFREAPALPHAGHGGAGDDEPDED